MKFGSGQGQCKSDITYYGNGVIVEVEENSITMEGNNGEVLILNFLDCTLNMSTRKNYEPKVGDIICWKGFFQDRRWTIMESIVFPQL